MEPPKPRSWRSLFIYRYRKRRVWQGAHEGSKRQMGSYRFRDVGGVCSAHWSVDKRAIITAAKDGLVLGRLMDNSHLQRNVLFYAKDDDYAVTEAIIGPTGGLLLGHENGTLLHFSSTPCATLIRGFTKLTWDTNDPLPVQKIDWISPKKAMILYRRESFPTCRLVLWDLEQQTSRAHVQGNNFQGWSFIDDSNFFYSSGGSICSTRGMKVPIYHDEFINSIITLQGMLLLTALHQSHRLVLFDPKEGKALKSIDPGGKQSILTAAYSSGEQAIFADEHNNVWSVRSGPDDDEGDSLQIAQLGQESIRSPIKALAANDIVIVVLWY